MSAPGVPAMPIACRPLRSPAGEAMAEPEHFDLVAIGGGFAGLCAALRGAEFGLRTAVLEAGADDRYLCSSRWAGGIFHVSYHDVKLSPAELVPAIDGQ